MFYQYSIFPIEKLLAVLLDLLHAVTDSYLLSLVLLSILVRLLVTPLERLASKSVKREHEISSVLGPQIANIKNRFKGGERHEAIRRLYKRYGYHPVYAVRSMFGLLVQLPFFLAAFYMIGESAELQGVVVPLIGDLGQQDKILFGTINLLPFVMTGINLLALYATPNFNKKESAQGIGIALLFLALLYNSPAALLIYWSTNQAISLHGSVLHLLLPGGIVRDRGRRFGTSVYADVLLLSFLTALYFFIISPLGIYLKNYEEFKYGLVDLFFESFPYFGAAFVLTLLPLVFVRGRFARYYSSALIVLLVVGSLNSELLYGNYGAFDGRGISIDPISFLTFVQVFLAFVVVFVVYRTNFRRIILNFVLICLAISFVFNFYEFGLGSGVYVKTHLPSNVDFLNFSKDDVNYLYIVLDEVYGGSTEKLFSGGSDLLEKFNGFVNYANVSGVFPTTIMSIPAILTGKVYKDGSDVDDFYEKSFSKSPLLKKLEKRLFDMKFHTAQVYSKYLPSGTFVPDSAFGGELENPFNEYAKILNLGMFKAVPEFMKQFIYKGGNWLVAEQKGVDRYINQFDFFVDNMHVGSEVPTFKFFHTTITHSPVRRNESCEISSEILSSTFENYLLQDACAFSQVGRLLDGLKALGVYDNTFIIVSSDHGRPYVSEEVADRFISSGHVSVKEYGYAHATLLVKPFGSVGELSHSDAPFSLIDINSLVLSDGDDIPKIAHGRTYRHYDWSRDYHDWGKKTLPPFTGVYLIDGQIYEPKSWSTDSVYFEKIISRNIVDSTKCGEKLFFGSSSSEKAEGKYFSTGLHEVEPWGRWSESKNVNLIIDFDDEDCNAKKLNIFLSGFVTKKNTEQNAKVLLNKNYIGDIVIKYGDEFPRLFTLDIPDGLFRHVGKNEISFYIEKPVSPKSVGHNNDPRKLGLGFRYLYFN